MGQVKTVKMSIFPKVIYKFGVLTIRNSKIFMEQANPVIHLENKMPKICQENFEKEKWKFALSTLEIVHKAVLIKAESYWHKDRQIDQWIRKYRKISKYLIGNLVYIKDDS